MGLGLQGAYGLQGAQGALRQRLIDRMAAEKQSQDLEMQRQDMQLRTRQIAGQEEDRRAALADRSALTAQRGTAALNTELTQLSPDTPISGGTQQRMVQGGVLPERLAPVPITPMAPPASLADPEQAPAGPLPGTMANSPSPAARQFLRVRSAPEQKIAEDDATQKAAQQRLLAQFPADSRQRAALEYETATGKNAPASFAEPPAKPGTIHDTPKGLVRIADDGTVTPLGVQGYHQPVANPESALVKVEHQDENGRTVVEWLPKSEIRGKTFKKGVSGATETRLASASAVTQTGEDIIAKVSSPDFAKQLGPAMGRYNTLRDFIGDPPPEFAELAGQIESYAIANMGVHGMRSAQGAEQIKKLMDKHHTPESMAATVRGLNSFSQHFMENEGRKTPARDTAAAPTSAPKRIRYDMNGKVLP
jgi:hypothetical protein